MHGLWCCGWGAVGAVFVANEARYAVYLLYWYKSTNTDAEGAASFSLNPSKSRHDYVVAVRVHLAAVHLGGKALVACALCALSVVGPW
jgi:hypothetical protein